MSIQNTRIRLLTEKLLRRNLQRGILPDSQEFLWQLEQALRDAGTNGSSFRFSPYKNTEIASSEKYNKDHQRIEQDFETLYQNLGGLHESLNKNYQYFDTEKKNLEKQIDVLENRLQAFIQNANRPGILPYAYDTFDDTSKVDLPSCSDIFVDTKNNLLRLVEERSTSRRVYPSGKMSFQLFPQKLDRKESNITGELASILNDNKDELWQKQVRLKDNKQLTGVLEVSLTKPTLLNRIACSFLTVKSFELHVTYSPNGAEWYELPNYIGAFEAQKDVSLDFPSVPVQTLRFSIKKQEADEIRLEGDGYDSRYLFGLESLSLYNKQYPGSGVFQSKALDLLNEPENYAVQNVSLHADEWVPTGTEIEYEIALAETNPDWQPIEPMGRKHPISPQTISFLRMAKNSGEDLYFPSNYSIHQSEAEDLLTNGIPLYRLTNLTDEKESFTLPPRKIREGSVQLFVGENSWEITSFPSASTQGVPSIQEYQGVFDETKVEYKEASKGRSGDVFQKKTDTKKRKYLARIALHLTSSRTITTLPVSTDPMAIYLNGENVYEALPGNQKEVHLVFQPGWNELVVLVNGEGATSVNGISTSLGFQPHNLTESIYSRSTSLKEVALFDLQYNTKMNDRTVFAKREVSDGWEILTNFWSAGLTFKLHYNYKAEDLPEHEQFLVRAKLTRVEGETVPTPIIRSYRIECT